jgi:hypothetical protein
MTKLSIQIQRRQRVIRTAVSIVKARTSPSKDAIAEFFAPVLASTENVPDCGFLLELISRKLAYEQSQVETSETKYNNELSDDIQPREDRDQTANFLYRELTQIRKEVDTAYGSRGTKMLGLVGDTPQEPALLLRVAQKIVSDLNDPAFDFGATISPRVSFARAEAAKILEPLCTVLGAYINKVDAEVGEAKQALDARNKASTSWRKNVPMLCAVGRALLRLSGDEEGAARLTATVGYRSNDNSDEVEVDNNEEPTTN